MSVFEQLHTYPSANPPLPQQQSTNNKLALMLD